MILVDYYILGARACYIVALMLVAYLLACGANALYEAALQAWRRRRKGSHGPL